MLDFNLALILRLILHDGEELLAALPLFARQSSSTARVANTSCGRRFGVLGLGYGRTALLGDAGRALVPSLTTLLAQTSGGHGLVDELGIFFFQMLRQALVFREFCSSRGLVLRNFTLFLTGCFTRCD